MSDFYEFSQERDDSLGHQTDEREAREMADPIYLRPSLSDRQKQIVTLIAAGKTTAEIAGILGIAYKTADSHRTRIMEKLNVHGTALLTRYAIRKGLVRP